MATSSSLVHEHQVYHRDEDIPFTPDGNDTFIGDRVEMVKERQVTSSAVTMRYVRKAVTIEERNKRTLLQEAKNLHRARHGHVVRLVMTYFYEREQYTRFAIIMERADGNLDAYLTGKTSRKKTTHLAQWFGCLVAVVAHIHTLGIRHRDIKPTNILIKDEQVLLADFGISKAGLAKTMPTTIPLLPRARTEGYCAPEVEYGSTRGRSADIFSLGAVFLEMLITYSYPTKRQDLEAILVSRGHRSYARTMHQVYKLMDDIEELKPEGWVLKVLSHTRKMLNTERTLRPPAEELNAAWLCLQPSDEPLTPCSCFKTVAATRADQMAELCTRGSVEGVRNLLASGADPNAMGALHRASVQGAGNIVELLLRHNADINLQDSGKQTALHCAASYGHDDIVKLLLEKGAKVELADADGQTPLHRAAAYGHTLIIQMLSARGADIQATDSEGRTALHCAARRGHDEVIQWLLERTANFTSRDRVGRTALHFAAGYGSLDVVARLVQFLSTETINVQDTLGLTALHFAARGQRAGGRYKEVSWLLEDVDADLTLKDDEGRTASWYSRLTSAA